MTRSPFLALVVVAALFVAVVRGDSNLRASASSKSAVPLADLAPATYLAALRDRVPTYNYTTDVEVPEGADKAVYMCCGSPCGVYRCYYPYACCGPPPPFGGCC